MIGRNARVTAREFEAIFESVCNWGRWGADDEKGTLNYISPEHVRRAASLVRSGRSVSLAAPIDTKAGPDNPNPAIHHMTQNHASPWTSSGACATGTATRTWTPSAT